MLETSPSGRPAVGRDPQRSAITNGKLLPGIDQRSAWARRCKDVIGEHLSDLGGADVTSAAERSLVRRASVMTVELERLEAKFALAGEADPYDLDLYSRITGNMRRVLETIGIKRRPRDVGPSSLADYVRSRSVETAP